MEAIICLVPELQSEMHSGCGMLLFKKTYVATVNFNVSVYYGVACVLVKKQLGSQQRQLEKPVVTTGAYIVSMDRKIIVYRLETGKTAFFGKHVQAVHSNMLPYFTGLLVILSSYCLSSSRAELHNSV